MYRTEFWTLWENARVGCFERTASIQSLFKSVKEKKGEKSLIVSFINT